MQLPCNGIIFDCDGVLFDSNTLKTKAFQETLLGYPDNLVQDFLTYHQTHGGISRYVKLRKFFTDFLQVDVDETKLTFLLEKFGEACQRLYQTANLTPGCRDVLDGLHQRVPLYVASGGAENELRNVFLKRDLAKYFQAIYGSPKTKSDCIDEIQKNAPPETTFVFVGDAASDWKAATNAGMSFIFMARFSEAFDYMQTQAEANKFPMIATLENLVDHLNVHIAPE